jgi:phosphohistidine phosphatase SixA
MRTARASRGRSPEDGAGGTGIPAAIPRRLVLPACGAALFLVPGAGSPAAPSEAAGWEALRAGGAVVLFRHATAPGTGDPSGMRLGDCSTQRNLDAAGRAQAARIGEAMRARGVAVGAVLASRWCRAAETADLAFPGRARAEPAFDSFFAERGEGPARTAEARRILLGWAGPGTLVVVTHRVNVTALAGVVPSSGEGVVLRRAGGDLVVAGRVKP